MTPLRLMMACVGSGVTMTGVDVGVAVGVRVGVAVAVGVGVMVGVGVGVAAGVVALARLEAAESPIALNAITR